MPDIKPQAQSIQRSVAAAASKHRPWDVLRFVAQLPNFARLYLRLLADARVKWSIKALFLATIAYVVSPLDFLPDLLPVLGQIDDLTLFVLVSRLFLDLSPRQVVQEHVAGIDREGRWRPFAE